jgi:hypothetical protein
VSMDSGHRRPSAAVLGVKNADAKHRLWHAAKFTQAA